MFADISSLLTKFLPPPNLTLKSETNQPITFCSTPADHRSGRHGYDAHKSLVMGWTISQKNRNEILYFAGDTAKISDIRMKGLALDIYQFYQHTGDNQNEIQNYCHENRQKDSSF